MQNILQRDLFIFNIIVIWITLFHKFQSRDINDPRNLATPPLDIFYYFTYKNAFGDI